MTQIREAELGTKVHLSAEVFAAAAVVVSNLKHCLALKSGHKSAARKSVCLFYSFPSSTFPSTSRANPLRVERAPIYHERRRKLHFFPF